MAVGKKDAKRVERINRIEKIKPGAGAPEGNLYRLKHGIFANRFLDEKEREVFDSLIEHLYKDFQFNKSSDFIQVELVAIYFLKLSRAQANCEWDAAEKLDRMIRCHLKDLRTTKIVREEASKKPGVTPAEWASSLMEKIIDLNAKPEKGKKQSTKKTKSIKAKATKTEKTKKK